MVSLSWASTFWQYTRRTVVRRVYCPVFCSLCPLFVHLVCVPTFGPNFDGFCVLFCIYPFRVFWLCPFKVFIGAWTNGQRHPLLINFRILYLSVLCPLFVRFLHDYIPIIHFKVPLERLHFRFVCIRFYVRFHMLNKGGGGKMTTTF